MSMSLNMQSQVQLRGVSEVDLQEIYERVSREHRTRVIFLDASYLYTFHLDDFDNVKKFNLLGRYYAQKLTELDRRLRRHQPVDPVEYDMAVRDNSLYCRQWHECLELWCDNKNVTLGDRIIKPINISRSLDRVVNEGLEMLAGCLTGQDGTIFDCRGIGDGPIDTPSLADEDLDNRIDLINVNETPEGGSLSRDGTTIYSVGNHSIETPTPDNNEFTECGMFDDLDTDLMHMLDHSVFDDPIPHTQNADSPGSTTVIYMCSG